MASDQSGRWRHAGQHVPGQVSSIRNGPSGFCARSLHPVGKSTFRADSRLAQVRTENTPRYPSIWLIERASRARQPDFAEARKHFQQKGYYLASFASLAPNDPLRELIVEHSPRYWGCVASLAWGDRSLRMHIEDQHHQLTEEQTAKMNYIISFDEFQAKLIRGPPPG